MVGDRNKASSEELGSPEKIDEEAYLGALRSYDCTFCKRGFTTAQALGGHMNVHRKDRAKMQRAGEASTPWKNDLRSVSCYRYYYHYSSHLKYNSVVPEPPRNSTMGFRTSGGRDRRFVDVGSTRPLEELRLFGSENGEEKVYDEESGLDLELRLGYDP